MVKNGQVIIIYSNPADAKRAYVTLPVMDGSFSTGSSTSGSGNGPANGFTQAQAYYVPNGVHGEAYSELVRIDWGKP